MGVLCSCAVSYTDAEGMGHIVGIVDVVVKRPAPENIAGSIVDVTTVGVSVLSWDDRLSMGLGYMHLTSADFLDNALAIGPFDKVSSGQENKTRE